MLKVMLKRMLSLAVLAVTLSATPSFAACTTDTQKAENKQYYTNQADQACCCKKQTGTSKYICDVVAKTDCVAAADVIKLSGPNYCPCEFTKSD